MEKFLTGPNLMALGLMIWAGWMLKNAAQKSKRSRNRDVFKEMQQDIHTNQRSAESQIQQLEVRLLEFDRDVSARVDTTLTLLDQLIAEADREIIRLETLLEERRGVRLSPLAPEQRRMVVHLAGAGYSIEEIAKLVDRTIEEVHHVLDGDHPDDQAA